MYPYLYRESRAQKALKSLYKKGTEFIPPRNLESKIVLIKRSVVKDLPT